MCVKNGRNNSTSVQISYIRSERAGRASLEGVDFYIKSLYLSPLSPPCPAPHTPTILWINRTQLPRRHPSMTVKEGLSPSHIIRRSLSRALPFAWEPKKSVITAGPRGVTTGFTLRPDLKMPQTAELSESGGHGHFPDRIPETLSSSA